jgi:hypothetical protein
MDELFRQILPSLGPFGVAGVLCWWIINNLQAALKEERAYSRELVKTMIETGQRSTQVLAELKAALKGGD